MLCYGAIAEISYSTYCGITYRYICIDILDFSQVPLTRSNSLPLFSQGEITFQAEYISPQGNGENSDKSPGDDRQIADGELGEEEDDPNTMPDGTPIPTGPEGDAMRAQKYEHERDFFYE